MNSRWRRLAGRKQSGLTLVELLVAIAILGVLGFLVLSPRTPRVTAPRMIPSSLPVPPPAPPPPRTYGGEMSLQETLDRFGYTVNVPHTYYGRPLLNRRSYRVSTRTDTVEAEWFQGSGVVQFQDLCRQSAYAGRTVFGSMAETGERIPILMGSHRRGGHGTAVPSGLPTPSWFYIDTSNGAGAGILYSNPQGNPDQRAQLIVLPARSGGIWVDEEGDQGHWEGGQDTGEYLLCWEDLVRGDSDFQDLVVLARGVQPGRN